MAGIGLGLGLDRLGTLRPAIFAALPVRLGRALAGVSLLFGWLTV
jgi:hypothetical protein